MIPEPLRDRLLAQAAIAPSVHNVQPARWRFVDDEFILFEDRSRRLAVGDPQARDAAMSLGAAAEGLALAASQAGFVLADRGAEALPGPVGSCHAVRRFALRQGGAPDPLANYVTARQSYRGAFAAATAADREAAEALASDSLAIVADPDRLREVARLADDAGMHFFRDGPFRAELLGWMRLSRRHPFWARDGLNAEAMAMAPPVAWGAKQVLGRRWFGLLDRLGLAGPALSEAGTIGGAAAVGLFHRPADEPRFDSGRAFYRTWLGIDAAGFSCAVMAALADDEKVASRLAEDAGLPPDRRIVSSWRIGRAKRPPYPRARLTLPDLLV
jgi:nitroreductase